MPVHRVHEQVIELGVRGPAAAELARALQERLSLLQRHKLAGIVDRVCTELSPGARVHRVESLELELGPVDLDDFEGDFCRKLELALRRALGDRIVELDVRRDDEAELRGRSAFELLELFAWTGNLPWWADRRRRGIVGAALSTLIEQPGGDEACRRLVAGLCARPQALARLVRAGDDSSLVALAERVSGRSLPALAQTVAELLVRAPRTDAGPALRERVWVRALTRASSTAGLSEQTDHPLEQWSPELEALLGPSARPGEGRGEPLALEAARAMFRELLTLDGVAGESVQGEPPDPRLGPAGAPELDSRSTGPEQAEADRPELGPDPPSFDQRGPNAPDPSLARPGVPAPDTPRLDEPDPSPARPNAPAPDAPHLDEPDPSPARPDPDQPGPAPARPGPDQPGPTRPVPSDSAALPTRIRALARALLAERPPASALRELQRWLASREATAVPVTTRAGLRAALRELLEPDSPAPPSRPSPRPRSLAEIDGLPVDNAGLVILWPFLERLLQRCGLVRAEDRAFVDERARARAVNALQYIAREELDAAEFALPLNKLLCGLEPDAPLDPAGLLEPLEPELLTECDRMLRAVVAHADILGEMSNPELRASFLCREGVLGTRDGAWLLQVERLPHDLVLDRFPWTWDWLSLPWMSAPLRVEW